MRPSAIKIGINNFLHDIKFDTNYYSLYNDILNKKNKLNDETFFLLILQTCLDTKFYGYFDELYVDVYKRKTEYIKVITNHFKTACVEPIPWYNKLYNYFCLCNRTTKNEIIFNQKIATINFDKMIEHYFVLNDKNKNTQFINKCEQIYNNSVISKLDENANFQFKNKSGKRVRFYIT
jgi:hypothetical protein